MLALEPVISGGVWSASSECVSLRRGSTGSPHYARYYTFTLEQYSNVTVDLESSQNTYLYLLSGHGAGGRVRVQDGDADDTTPNTHVSLDLSQGVYTIEATTFDAEVEGSFTLVAVDPPLPNPVVGEPFSYGFSFVARWWSPWVHANMPWVQSVTPSTGLSLELTYRHHPTTRQIVVTVSDTPTHEGDYTVTFAYLRSNGSANTFTNRIRVDCPTETTRQSDRTCLENFVMGESDVPGGQKRYPVSFAALKGMRLAADDWVGKYQLNDNGQLANNEHCGTIPVEYRLTRNMLVAVLVAIQFHELYPSGQANSLMDLSRGDRYFFPLPEGETAKAGNRVVNKVLYSLNDPSDEYGRAFWHPAVGLYQLDDANTSFASKLNHAERAHAKTSASTALAILHLGYCEHSANVSTEAQAKSRLNSALYPWYGCHESRCLSTVDDLVEGNFFSDTNKRLYLNVDRLLIDENGGGVYPLECRWSTSAPNDRFACFMYDIRRAEGYVWLSGSPSGTKGRSPLAHPFLSFTRSLPGSTNTECPGDSEEFRKFVVFRHIETGYTRPEVDDDETVRRELDLIAAVPCGKDVRRTFSGTGWWSMDEINGVSVVVVHE